VKKTSLTDFHAVKGVTQMSSAVSRDQGAQKSREPYVEQAEVVAGSDEGGINAVAAPALEATSVLAVQGLGVADDKLDGVPTLHFAADGHGSLRRTNSSDSEPPPFSFLVKFLHVVHNADQLNPSSPYRVFMDDGIAVAPRGSLFFAVE
jgi:hypothetical protein